MGGGGVLYEGLDGEGGWMEGGGFCMRGWMERGGVLYEGLDGGGGAGWRGGGLLYGGLDGEGGGGPV